MEGLRGLPGLPFRPVVRPPAFGPRPGLPAGGLPVPLPAPFPPRPGEGLPDGFAPALAGLPPAPGRAPLGPAGFLRGLLAAGCVASEDESRTAANSTASSVSVRSRQRPTGKPRRLPFITRPAPAPVPPC